MCALNLWPADRRNSAMDIKRYGSQPSAKGPAD
jgi:hypothetical protein